MDKLRWNKMSLNTKKALPIPGLRQRHGANKDRKPKGRAQTRHTTTVWRFRAERPPFSQIAKVFCGRAIVSIHMRPVSTPSLRSVGHSSHVHGTQAQIYLATSPYLNVVCKNRTPQDSSPSWAAERQVKNEIH
jgi:hypothetical protein